MVVSFGHLLREVPPMSFSELPTIARFREDSLEVFVYENRALAGRAAAQWNRAGDPVAAACPGNRQRRLRGRAEPERVSGRPGRRRNDIDWSRVTAFHMDEYLGIDADHPVSFRRYLQEHLFRLVGLGPIGCG